MIRSTYNITFTLNKWVAIDDRTSAT